MSSSQQENMQNRKPARGETRLQPSPSSSKKKKRSLPGTPDPTAEVIALSPATLMATNRFICEICSKGFQRDQNLQLHRRGHNLPWKLRRQRGAGEEARKRVYVCPEPGCVHHNPARALGDLTGIKKHYCRKHGEKKWTCERCSKSYAVQSDWKAHMKTCGSREYRCDCGSIFSRRDSFVTHRAFCDALAEGGSRRNDRIALLPPLPSPPPVASNPFSLPGGLLPVEGSSVYTSATALLQKAAQVGATSSFGGGAGGLQGWAQRDVMTTVDFMGVTAEVQKKGLMGLHPFDM